MGMGMGKRRGWDAPTLPPWGGNTREGCPPPARSPAPGARAGEWAAFPLRARRPPRSRADTDTQPPRGGTGAELPPRPSSSSSSFTLPPDPTLRVAAAGEDGDGHAGPRHPQPLQLRRRRHRCAPGTGAAGHAPTPAETRLAGGHAPPPREVTPLPAWPRLFPQS